MMMLTALNFTLPITDPTWIFLIVLVIILLAPIIFGKLRIPHIIGMILAGVIIGEHGLNILERDSSFQLFGQVGLYYIMFLAGLEMDMEDFRKNSIKGLVFGLLTFAIPMILGIWSSVSILNYSLVTAVLLASMYASHTLIAYPIVSRYGLSRQRSVTISIGGTAITVTLALLILAVISGMFRGEVNLMFWVNLALKVTIIGLIIIFVFPRIGRWFFRKYSDNVLQFVFVLAMVFLGGGLIDLAGMEGILGAFLVGMMLNPLVPKVSPLMNRLEFVGNALFIPYFLIGVGMIIDVRSFVTGGEALKVAVVMTVVATASKWLAAFATQKIYKMSGNERKMMFGLSNAQAAATLAAVLVGHDIIMDNGERLLNDDVLNGTIVMILVTCIISTIVTENASRKFALGEGGTVKDGESRKEKERLLIPVANPDNIENLVNLALVMRNPERNDGIVALNVINDGGSSPELEAAGKRSLEKAAQIAASVDIQIDTVSRYDLNISSGIVHTMKEYGTTDIIIGLHKKGSVLDSYFGSLTGTLLKNTNKEVIVARLLMPINTMKGIVVVVPPRAEFETGFRKWVLHLCRIASEVGCKMRFYAEDTTAELLGPIVRTSNARTLTDIITVEKQPYTEKMTVKVDAEELLVAVSARSASVSYDPAFDRLPAIINRNYHDSSLLIIYPEQVQGNIVSFTDPIQS